MKTTTLKKKDLTKDWYIIDCNGIRIGRVASVVAPILQGKNKSNYSPNLNNGDSVVLINTSKIAWTGKKDKQKVYKKHSGFQGGMKEVDLKEMLSKNPNIVLEHAVSLMLPKNRMRDEYMKNLYCYKDAEHKHDAQKPKLIDLKS